MAKRCSVLAGFMGSIPIELPKLTVYPIRIAFTPERYCIFRPVMGGPVVVAADVEILVPHPNLVHLYIILVPPRAVILVTAMAMIKPATIIGITIQATGDIVTPVAITITATK
jgi:hypothetical protein